jgi:hypothetical protein
MMTIAALATTAGVVVSVIAVLVTVRLWRSDIRRRERDDDARRRSVLIEQVVRLAERSARLAPFRLITQLWFHHELEWALLLPRLYYQLSPAERSIAIWVALRVQLIQRAIKPEEIVELGGEIAYRLASWERQETSLSWFVEATKEVTGFPRSWKVSTRRRAEQSIALMWRWLKFDVLLAALVAAILFTVRSFRKP